VQPKPKLGSWREELERLLASKDYDCFVPLEIGYLAKWAVTDSDRGGEQRGGGTFLQAQPDACYSQWHALTAGSQAIACLRVSSP
jgi:hypothetical protein